MVVKTWEVFVSDPKTEVDTGYTVKLSQILPRLDYIKDGAK